MERPRPGWCVATALQQVRALHDDIVRNGRARTAGRPPAQERRRHEGGRAQHQQVELAADMHAGRNETMLVAATPARRLGEGSEESFGGPPSPVEGRTGAALPARREAARRYVSRARPVSPASRLRLGARDEVPVRRAARPRPSVVFYLQFDQDVQMVTTDPRIHQSSPLSLADPTVVSTLGGARGTLTTDVCRTGAAWEERRRHAE